MKTVTEILEDLSCPECEAFHGEREYQLLIAQAKSELRALVSEIVKNTDSLGDLARDIQKLFGEAL